VTAARAAGDAALLVEAAGRAGPLAAAIRAQRLPGVLDAVAGARTVLVITEPGSWDLGALAARVAAVPDAAPDPAGQPLAEIPVLYDGPDLAEVAGLTGLPVGEVVARHAAREYTVGWLGFCPGFGYLTGLDPALEVPRLGTPRLRVPAGSVAVAGGLAAVYPSESPGGWRLLGRTAAVLWNAEREPPALLAPGMRVRFRPVSELPPDLPGTPGTPGTSGTPGTLRVPGTPGVFGTPRVPGTLRVPGTPGVFGTPRVSGTPRVPGMPGVPGMPRRVGFHDLEGFASPSTPNPSGSWEAAAGIEVVRPGPLATVQDLGRPGLGHLGVPRSGAADAASLQRANQLAGNPPGAAGLEFTLGRAVLRFGRDALAAIAGAAAPVTLTTGPNQAAIAVESGVAFGVPAGAVLRIGTPVGGLRTYLAVQGGIDVPAVLGSRSADLLSRLGPAPLRAGDLLPIGAAGPAGVAAPLGTAGPLDTTGPLGTAAPPSIAGHDAAGHPASLTGPQQGQAVTGPVELRVLPGPRDEWFAAAAIELLCTGHYVVTPACDRAGLRLHGRALARATSGTTSGTTSGSSAPPPAPPAAAGPASARSSSGGSGSAASSAATSGSSATTSAATSATSGSGASAATSAASSSGSAGELASEGMVTGALQVPPDGQPILLLADHPVTGGYPVIAVVRSADIGAAAQLRPGQLVRFTVSR